MHQKIKTNSADLRGRSKAVHAIGGVNLAFEGLKTKLQVAQKIVLTQRPFPNSMNYCFQAQLVTDMDAFINTIKQALPTSLLYH